MSDTLRVSLDTDAARESLSALRDDVEALVERDLTPLAAQAEQVFTSLGDAIGGALEDASERGRVSVKALVNDVLADLSRLAAERFVKGPIEQALGDIFGGARAGGGVVSPGVPYLVGERGPELFVPPSAGAIAPQANRPITVNISMSGEGAGDPLGRSGSQLAGAVGRALSKAMRNG